MTWEIRQGDCRAVLRELPGASVQCCVTSPPYWGLRSYVSAGDPLKPLELGLEATPDEYVAHMVEVFREVRRALRPDGTLWLNLGDCYANDGKWGGYSGGKHAAALHGETGIGRAKRETGLKPKDLVGIPWSVARALQEPYYAGKIRDPLAREWLAAMIDGEGCMFLHRRKEGQGNGQGYTRKADSFGAGLEVANTHHAVVERCAAITGLGSICRQDKDRRQPLYRWNLRSNECRDVIREVYPHLVAKQHQARLLLGCPSSGERATAAWEGLKILHRGGLTDVDFAPPASIFEPGYWLRMDVVWSKLNPMPESVTDRPTKAHEYVFLLSKSADYFYDADAIAEDAISTAPSGNGFTGRQGGSERVGPQGGGEGAAEPWDGVGGKRNARSVWTITTKPFSGAHFAVMPWDLAERCVLAGSAPDSTVLDPFAGAGTVGMVARRHGRSFVGVELNPAYAEMARARIEADAPLLNRPEVA